MLSIIKYLKQYWIQVLILVVMLVGQAYCDLALPQYTSDIVDVGIQQKGIKDAALEAISESTFEKILLFVTDDEEKTLKEYYKFIEKDSDEANQYKDSYPLVRTESIYVLDTKEKDVLEEIKSCLNIPLTIVSSFTKMDLSEMMEKMSSSEETTDPLSNMNEEQQRDFMMKLFTSSVDATAANTPMTPELMEQFGKLQTMSEEDTNKMITEKLNALVKKEKGEATALNGLELFYEMGITSKKDLLAINDNMNKQFGDMAELMISQMAVASGREEYQKLDMNVDKIQKDYLVQKGLQMILLALLITIISVTVGFIASRVAARVGMNIRGRLFKKVIFFSNTEIDRFSNSSLITRSTNDIQQVQMVVVLLLRMMIYAPILGIGGVIKVISTKTSMGWIIGLTVGIILLLVIVALVIALPKFKLMQTLVDRLNLVTREILTGLPVIRAFSREHYEEKRFEKANQDLTRTTLFTNRVMSLMMPVMMFIMNGVVVLIMWSGAHGIDAGHLQVGNMMAFISYTMQIIMSFLMLTMLLIFLPRAAVSAKRIDEVLVVDPIIKDKEITKEIESVSGTLAFNNVSFAYPEAEEEVLSEISFTARPGETTAIIGSTGSGKSTMMHLLPRFYDVTSGSITIDGMDIRDLTQHDLRSLIGFVPQKGTLFSGTIASNLRFGREEATDEEIASAADIAQAKGFIEEKDDQYESHVAQGGSNVSGGQKQRLAIARAIAKNPKIFIFDDSFSALDFKTDIALRRALREKVSNSTIIIVAQRISTILHAEQILVLDDGRIVGQGTHEQLLESCEVYRQIAQSQLSEEELLKKGRVENE